MWITITTLLIVASTAATWKNHRHVGIAVGSLAVITGVIGVIVELT